MQDRLKLIMQREGLSATEFAESIGVQPSAISHLISGRNKPSFDFLSSLFEVYPNINPRWVVLGTGGMYYEEVEEVESSESADQMSLYQEDYISKKQDCVSQEEHAADTIGDAAYDIEVKVHAPTASYTEAKAEAEVSKPIEKEDVSTKHSDEAPLKGLGQENSPYRQDGSHDSLEFKESTKIGRQTALRKIEKILILYDDGSFEEFVK